MSFTVPSDRVTPITPVRLLRAGVGTTNTPRLRAGAGALKYRQMVPQSRRTDAEATRKHRFSNRVIVRP